MDLVNDIIVHIANILFDTTHYDTLWSLGTTCKSIRRLLINNAVWHNLYGQNIALSATIHNHKSIWYYILNIKYTGEISARLQTALKYKSTNIVPFFSTNIQTCNFYLPVINLLTILKSYSPNSPSNAIIKWYYISGDSIDIMMFNRQTINITVTDVVLAAHYLSMYYIFYDILGVNNALARLVIKNIVMNDICDPILCEKMDISEIIKNCINYNSPNITEYILQHYGKKISTALLFDIIKVPVNNKIAELVYAELRSRNKVPQISFNYDFFNMITLKLLHRYKLLNLTVYEDCIYATKGKLALRLKYIKYFNFTSDILLSKFTSAAYTYLKSDPLISELIEVYKFILEHKYNMNCVPIRKYIVKNFDGVNIFRLLRALDDNNILLTDINLSINWIGQVISRLYKENKLTYGVVCNNKWLITKMCKPHLDNCHWQCWWRLLREYELI